MRNDQCTLCSLHSTSDTVCLWGKQRGAPSGVMVIGDAPSMQDARVGEYLQGNPGKVLIPELENVGIKDFYYTGVVKCQPPDNRKPETAEIKACAGYLAQEIETRNPKFILVLGATAVKAVCKEAKITGVVGKRIEKDGRTYVPCFSPAYMIRDPGKTPEVRSAFKRFSEIVRGSSQEAPKLRIRIIDRSNLEEFQEAFSQEEEFTCDLETSGLDWYNDSSYINCIGMYLPKDGAAWVLPIKKTPTLPEVAQQKLVTWIAEQQVPVINQNWKFDSLWLWKKFGVSFYCKDDTMLAHYNLDENTPHGLKENARFFLGAPDYDLTTSEKKGNVDSTKLFTYCAWDTFWTYGLIKLFRRQLMSDAETRNIYRHLTMPAERMYEVIEREGHYVNLERFQATEKDLTIKLAAAEKQLNEMAGREVNWNSTRQVAEVLYKDFGIVPKVFTEKGAASTGEAALAELDHPVAELLKEYRSHQKFLSTYIEGWKEFMVGPYLYLGTKLHGTVTGRYSSRLHQVPREGTIRNLIEAPEGWTFVQADLSQAELRVVAIISQDPELIHCYNNGIDVHWRTTISVMRMGGSPETLEIARRTVEVLCQRSGEETPSTMAGILDYMEQVGHDACIEVNKYWKEKRKHSKGINFGYVYGMGAKKFVEYAKIQYDWDVELEESERIREGFFNTYQRLRPWHDRARDMVRIDGFVRSLSGRMRRLPGIYSSDRMMKAEAERQAINSPVQGFIGDLKVMGMLDIYDQLQVPYDGERLRMKGEVHDSILMWVKNEYLNEMLPKIKACMEKPSWLERFGINLPVPIVADLEVGTWGAGKTWHGEML